MVVQQAFSRMVPQHPKKATTKVTLPMTIMQIGMVWVLTPPSKAVKLPIVESMMEPTTMSRMPPATNTRLSKYSRYLNIADRQFMVLGSVRVSRWLAG